MLRRIEAIYEDIKVLERLRYELLVYGRLLWSAAEAKSGRHAAECATPSTPAPQSAGVVVDLDAVRRIREAAAAGSPRVP